MNKRSAELLAARVYLYSLFQRLFAEEPTEEMARAIEGELIREAFMHVAVDRTTESDAAIDSHVEALTTALKDVGACRQEYTRLFIGPGKLPTPPWESVWMLDDRALFTRVTLDVRNAYRAAGFIPTQYPQVSDDHLALELDFMAHLARRMQESYDAERTEAYLQDKIISATFLNEHMGAWIEKFAARLLQEHAPLYAPVTQLLVRFVSLDARFLREDRNDE